MPYINKEQKAEMLAYIEKRLAEDYTISTNDLYEELHEHGLAHMGHDGAKRHIINLRKKHLPTLDDIRHPSYNQKFDWRRHPGTMKEKTLAYITNQLYRNKYQSATDLFKAVENAGLKPGVGKATFAIWVSDMRKETGQTMTHQEAAFISRVKLKAGPKLNRNPKPKIDIEAPPPSPGEVTITAAKRLATDLISEAVAMAGRRQTRGNQDARYSGTRAPSFDVRYAQAWLQTPSATAMWCDLIGVDPDVLASWSEKRHGRPTFSSQEIRSFRTRVAESSNA